MSDDHEKPADQLPPNLELDKNDLHDDPSRPFANLLDKPEDAKAIFVCFHDSIAKSFARDAQQNPFRVIRPTRDEIRRRFKICETWFRHARADLGYSTDRACDLMYRALCAELDGVEFDPGQRNMLWTPS